MTRDGTAYRQRNNSQADVQVQFRCSPTLRARLFKEAARRQVSVNLLIESALSDALTKWEKQRLP